MFKTIRDVLLENAVELSLLKEEYLSIYNMTSTERKHKIVLNEALARNHEDLVMLYKNEKDIHRLEAIMIVNGTIENMREKRRKEKIKNDELNKEMNLLKELLNKTRLQVDELLEEIVKENLKGNDVSHRTKEKKELEEYKESIIFRIEELEREMGI